MDNLVSTVFKIMGITLLLLILTTIGQTLFSIYNVSSKVMATSILLQSEIAKHNGLPKSVTSDDEDGVDYLFANRLMDETVNNDSFFTSLTCNFGPKNYTVSTNSKFGVAVDGIDPIVTGDERDYGEFVDVIIKVGYYPFGMVGSGSADTFKKVKSATEQYLTFKYTVPCLHFNK